MTTMPTHSTPAGVVKGYFESVRWLKQQVQSSEDAEHVRRLTAITAIQAVTSVEVFLNLWFRTIVAEKKDAQLEQALLCDLKDRVPLDRKLATWPKRHLGNKLDLRKGPGFAFVELKSLRNAIVHFESAYETVHKSQIIIHGLADTSKYDALSGEDAGKALVVAEDIVAEIFRLADFDAIESERAQAGWIGKVAPKPMIDPTAVDLAPWLSPHVSR